MDSSRSLETKEKMNMIDALIDGDVSDNSTHHYQKVLFLKRIKDLFKSKIFIETGTADGNMIGDLLNDFERLYSIEAVESRADNAKLRFSDQKHVEILSGCSGKIIELVCNSLQQSDTCLFFLDGHQDPRFPYAVDIQICPLIDELTAIFTRKNKFDVIAIDDFRLIGTEIGWPSLEDIEKITIQNNFETFLCKNRDVLLLKAK